jgi:hypothetical protein
LCLKTDGSCLKSIWTPVNEIRQASAPESSAQ